jgi:hypothetical protein
VLAALLAGPLFAEGLLRWLLFSPHALARRWGEGLRRAELYVASPYSDDFNKLSWLFQPAEVRERPALFGDAEIGWLKSDIEPGTFRHVDEERLGERRPVLLYGTSFARCKWPQEPCFEDLLEASELAPGFALLNYAVQGHGLDQTLLLLRRSLPRHVERDPIVVVAFVVEADPDRNTLSFFSRPKPRFVPSEGAFALVCPDELGAQAFLARHPPAIASYFWRYLVNAASGSAPETRQRWEGEAERRSERDAVTEYLLAELERECSGLEHFLLLFHMKRALLAETSAEERELRSRLERLGLPWLDVRPAATRALSERGCTLDQLYDPWDGHPTALGTEVFFESLVLGLRGERHGGARR